MEDEVAALVIGEWEKGGGALEGHGVLPRQRAWDPS